MIYTIGDSHISFLSGLKHYEITPDMTIYDSNPPGYKIIRLFHKVSAYSLKSSGKMMIENILKTCSLYDEDILVFSFGEIDIRYYLTKDIINGIDPMITLENAIYSYNSFLHDMKKIYKNIYVLAPIPQIIKENELEPDAGFLDEYTRDTYTKIFNEKLKDICFTLNIGFIDMRKYVENNNNLYEDDKVHLTGECRHFFEKELEEVKKYVKCD
jgi:hypothetical protein